MALHRVKVRLPPFIFRCVPERGEGLGGGRRRRRFCFLKGRPGRVVEVWIEWSKRSRSAFAGFWRGCALRDSSGTTDGCLRSVGGRPRLPSASRRSFQFPAL